MNAKAEHNLGLMYLQERGREKDERKGIEWLTKAAEQGRAVSQDLLGLTLRDGSDEVRNLSEAVEWFRKATKQDHVDAKTRWKN